MFGYLMYMNLDFFLMKKARIMKAQQRALVAYLKCDYEKDYKETVVKKKNHRMYNLCALSVHGACLGQAYIVTMYMVYSEYSIREILNNKRIAQVLCKGAWGIHMVCTGHELNIVVINTQTLKITYT